MYSTVPTGSLVTLGGHLRVVLHSDDATATVSADPPCCHWRAGGRPPHVDSTVNAASPIGRRSWEANKVVAAVLRVPRANLINLLSASQ